MSEKITRVDENELTYHCHKCNQTFFLEFEHAVRMHPERILSIECEGCNTILNLLLERRKKPILRR